MKMWSIYQSKKSLDFYSVCGNEAGFLDATYLFSGSEFPLQMTNSGLEVVGTPELEDGQCVMEIFKRLMKKDMLTLIAVVMVTPPQGLPTGRNGK